MNIKTITILGMVFLSFTALDIRAADTGPFIDPGKTEAQQDALYAVLTSWQEGSLPNAPISSDTITQAMSGLENPIVQKFLCQAYHEAIRKDPTALETLRTNLETLEEKAKNQKKTQSYLASFFSCPEEQNTQCCKKIMNFFNQLSTNYNLEAIIDFVSNRLERTPISPNEITQVNLDHVDAQNTLEKYIGTMLSQDSKKALGSSYTWFKSKLVNSPGTEQNIRYCDYFFYFVQGFTRDPNEITKDSLPQLNPHKYDVSIKYLDTFLKAVTQQNSRTINILRAMAQEDTLNQIGDCLTNSQRAPLILNAYTQLRSDVVHALLNDSVRILQLSREKFVEEFMNQWHRGIEINLNQATIDPNVQTLLYQEEFEKFQKLKNNMYRVLQWLALPSNGNLPPLVQLPAQPNPPVNNPGNNQPFPPPQPPRLSSYMRYLKLSSVPLSAVVCLVGLYYWYLRHHETFDNVALEEENTNTSVEQAK